MSTADTKLKGQALRTDLIPTFEMDAGEHIGYETAYAATDYPKGPVGTNGYILYGSANDTAKLMDHTNYFAYQGVSESAARLGKPVTVRAQGIVWLPVGAIDVAVNDYVQATPDILDGSAATKSNCLFNDIIPAFAHTRYIHAASSTSDPAADTAQDFDNSREFLKILLCDVHTTGSTTAAWTVKGDGFASTTGTWGSTEVGLYNAAQGVYASQWVSGDAATDGDDYHFAMWEKCNLSVLSPWTIGQAVAGASARTDADTFEFAAIKLRGF